MRMKPEDLEPEDVAVLSEKVPEGRMNTYFEVLHRTEEGRPDGWMTHIWHATVDGKDRTEKYLKKAFDGKEIRGIPDEKLKKYNVKVISK